MVVLARLGATDAWQEEPAHSKTAPSATIEVDLEIGEDSVAETGPSARADPAKANDRAAAAARVWSFMLRALQHCGE
jgi:hypothetical protein